MKSDKITVMTPHGPRQVAKRKIDGSLKYTLGHLGVIGPAKKRKVRK